LASVLLADIERVEEELRRATTPATVCHLTLSNNVQARLGTLLGLEDRKAIEQFVLDELDEAPALLLPENGAPGEELAFIELLGVTCVLAADLVAATKS
jgi:hypothetical protein